MKFTEREHDLSLALYTIRREIQSFHMEVDLHVYGRDWAASSVCLSKNGTTSERGCGKGFDKQAIASGLFEAFEHWVSNYEQFKYPTRFTNLKEIKSSMSERSYDIHLPEICSNGLSILEQYYGNWLEFSNTTNDKFIYSPLFVHDGHASSKFLQEKDPAFEKLNINSFPFLRQNNGIAIGMSKNEAVLHGLNEQIERFSKSSFFFRQLRQDSPDATIVPEWQLEQLFPDLYKKLIQLTNQQILVIHLKNAFNHPCFVAVCGVKGLRYPLIGSGASLSAFCALERALTELLQLQYLSQDISLFAEYLIDDERMTKLAAHIDGYNELRMFQLKLPVETVDLNTNNLSVEEQVKYIIRCLDEHFVDVYFRDLYSSRISTISAVQTLIPKFSYFYLIEDGLLTDPSSMYTTARGPL